MDDEPIVTELLRDIGQLQARVTELEAALRGVVAAAESALRQIDMAMGGFDDRAEFVFIRDYARKGLGGE